MFQPLIPLSGLPGWKLLQATEGRQRNAFSQTSIMAREIARFEEGIANIDSPKALVEDYNILKVALGAFGLEEEIYKKALIEKVLEGGTEDSDSFANRLVDVRWVRFAKAFGFGNAGGAPVGSESFAQDIADKWRDRSFELAVGQQDNAMRLALNFRREAQIAVDVANPETTGWYNLLGSPPMRSVVETAFGLGSGFAALDLDRQLEILGDKTAKMFGDASSAVFAEPENIEKLLENFFLRDSLARGPSASTPGYTALQLLGAPVTGGLVF